MKKIFTKKINLLAALLFLGLNSWAQCTFTGLNPNYCVNSPTSALTTTSTGGSFSGPGVIGSTFDPALAGPGTHTITYGICTSSYAVTGGTGTAWYAPIPMPTVTTGPETPTAVTLGDDEVTLSALPIGFNFKFYCTNYNTFYISSNGFITFSAGQSNGCCSGQALPTTTSPNNLITLTWEDFYPPGGGTITFATVGTAPNRKLLVNFNNIPHFGSGGGPQTAQLQLYETTNVIEIHTYSMVTDGGNHTMGLKDAAGTSYTVVTGRNSTTTWSAVNEMYRFTPGTSCAYSQTTIVSPSTITVVGTNSICSGATTSLTATGNNTYTWSTGSNAAGISVSPTSNTTYSVSGTNSYGCVANAALTVTVDTTPTVTAVNATGTSGVCPGRTVALNGTGATSYAWTGGITNGTSFTIASSSSYTVTGSNACGSATAAISVSIHPLPSVTAIASTPTLCSGNTVTMTGVGTATSYAWSSNPVVPGLANGVGIFPSANTSFTVIGTSALSCTNSAVNTVTVVTTPALAPTSSPTLICKGSSSNLSATGATNYNWIPGGFTTSGITVSPTITTTYTLTKSNANCVDIKTITLYVNNLPTVFALSTPTIICANGTATLSGGGASSYTWTNSNPSFNLTGAIVAVSPSATTIYSVAASDGTCVGTTSVVVSTNPNPTISIGATSTVICAGQSSTLSLGGGINYTWTPSNLSGSTAVVSPTISTLYTIVGDNAFNCTGSNSQIVLVNPVPPVNAVTNRTLVCVGGSATLTAFGADTYNWSNTANTTITVVNPAVTTVYTVVGTYVATGCQNSKTISVSVFSPTFTVSGSNSVCIGGAITLSASGASSYTWNVNPPSPFPSIVVSPTVPTVYVVSATSFSNGVGCIASQSKSISIYMNPTITATPQRTLICKNETTNLLGSGGATYVWSTSQTGSAVPVAPTVLTVYSVTGTDANGCVGTATTQVKVSNCLGISQYGASTIELEIYPNPNNGEFTISAPTELQLKLINELGQTILLLDLNQQNDHKVSVKNIANGIYFIVGQKGDLKVNQKIVVTN